MIFSKNLNRKFTGIFMGNNRALLDLSDDIKKLYHFPEYIKNSINFTNHSIIHLQLSLQSLQTTNNNPKIQERIKESKIQSKISFLKE